jgi:hypothetical protein
LPYKDPEKEREYNRQYRERNRERYTQYMREWRAKHPEQKEKDHQYYLTHQEEAREATFRWREKEENKEKERQKALEYYYQNWEKIRERRNNLPIEMRIRNSLRTSDYHRVRRRGLIQILGGKCAMCGFADMRALQLDHINGNGKQDLKRLKSTQLLVVYYLDHQDEAKQTLQILCANCNWIKRHDKKEYRTLRKR